MQPRRPLLLPAALLLLATASADAASHASDGAQQQLAALMAEVLPGADVRGQLAELGVLCVSDLWWTTDAELEAMGAKPIQRRKLRHAAERAAPAKAADGHASSASPAAASAGDVPPAQDPTPSETEAEVLCLRSGQDNCAASELLELLRGADQPEPEQAMHRKRQEDWAAAHESDLKSLLASLSLSVAEQLDATPPEAGLEEAPPPPPPPVPSVTTPKDENADETGDYDPLSVPDPIAAAAATTAAAAVLQVDGGSATPGLFATVEQALHAARHGSSSAPPAPPMELASAQRQRLAFAVVGEASALVAAGRLRAALQLQQDALLLDSSAAAAHHNNIGVTHARLNEMVHAAESLDNALVAAAAGRGVWSEVRSGATQAVILSNKWRLEQLQQLPVKERAKALNGAGFLYLSQEHASLWLSAASVSTQAITSPT